MAMARYQFTVTDDAGNVVPGAHIEVRKELPGAALAALKSDRDGLVGMSNPFDADSEGFAAFHVIGGAYKVRAYTGPSGAPTFEKIWRYVPVGLAAELDNVSGDIATTTHAAASKTTPVDADEIPLVDSAASNFLKKLTWANLKAAIASYLVSAGLIREKLLANRTYYVLTTGSDTNNGLANTSGGAFLTPQKALDIVFGTLDLGGFNVDIQLGAGTYTGNFIASSPQVGAGVISIKGDTTVANTGNYVLNCVSGTALTVSGFGTKLAIQGFEVRGNAGISATNGGYLSFSGYMRFGPCSSDHMRANNGTIDTMQQPIGIAGGATSCLRSSPNGYLNTFNSVITILTGTWNFSTAFAQADRGSVLTCSGATFTLTGTATGVRYDVSTNGVIFTSGGGPNFFPGNSAGTTATGGQYA